LIIIIWKEVIDLKIIALPKSLSGWFSLCLVIISILFFFLFSIILGPGPDYNMSLAYALTAVIGCIVAAALIIGLVGIIRNKERSILVFIALLISLLTLFGSITSLLGLQK